MTLEYKYFKNEYLDAIAENYMRPVFEDTAAFLKRNPPRDLLDIGCGNGLFGADLKRLTGSRLTGIDASGYALERAREAGFDATVLCEDLCSRELGVPPASFDLALCKDVLEHLLDPAALLQRIGTALRPGGRLLCLVPNHFTVFGRAKFLFTANLDTYGFFPDSREWDYPHIRFFTKPGFLGLLRSSGFHLERDYGAMFFHRVPMIWRAPGYRAIMSGIDRFFPTAVETAFVGLFRKDAA